MKSHFDMIVQGFNSRLLDKALWTHEAHQIVAIWYIIHYEPEDALCRIRSGIIAYNLSTGVENNGQNGYHETITVFWWKLIGLYIRENPNFSFEAMCTSFFASRYTHRNIGLEFYSKELLLSTLARSRYFAPDIKEVAL